MLLRNINQTTGLCSGARLIVTQLATRVTEVDIIIGSNVTTKVFILRISMFLMKQNGLFVKEMSISYEIMILYNNL